MEEPDCRVLPQGCGSIRTWLPAAVLSRFAEIRFRMLEGGKRLRHVILPGKILFVYQRPQQTAAAGGDAQASAEIAQQPLTHFRLLAIEIGELQARPDHPRSLGIAERPDQPVEQ